MDLTRQLAGMLPVQRVTAGVVVASIGAGVLNARDGELARGGDVIYAVNRTTVSSVGELRAALDALKTGDR
jgi:S1-C subfamily serine protease